MLLVVSGVTWFTFHLSSAVKQGDPLLRAWMNYSILAEVTSAVAFIWQKCLISASEYALSCSRVKSLYRSTIVWKTTKLLTCKKFLRELEAAKRRISFSSSLSTGVSKLAERIELPQTRLPLPLFRPPLLEWSEPLSERNVLWQS